MKSFKTFVENSVGAIGAPSNNTRSVPGAGDDSSLKMRRARMFKQIYRRHNTTKEETKVGVTEDSKYYLQPGGKWKKGADGRSPGKTLKELEELGLLNKIDK